MREEVGELDTRGEEHEEEVNELYTSGEQQETEELAAALDSAPSVYVEVVQEGSLLKGRVNLPHLRTWDGARYVGVASIREYLRKEEEKAQRESQSVGLQ